MEKFQNKGITLIALIITIIVLLILAGVSIATLTGENGLITRAGDAEYETEKAQLKENLQIEALSSLDTNGKFDIGKCEENIRNNLKIPSEQIAHSSDGTIIVSQNDYSFEITKDGEVIETDKEGEDFDWTEQKIAWIGDTTFNAFPQTFNNLTGRPYPDGNTMEMSAIEGFTKTTDYESFYTIVQYIDQNKEYFQAQNIDTLIIGSGYGDIVGVDNFIRSNYEYYQNYPIKDVGTASDTTSDTVINDFRDAIELTKSALPDMNILFIRTYPWDYEQMEKIYKVSIGATEEQFSNTEIQESLNSTINRANTLYTELEKLCGQLGVEYLDLSTYTIANRDTFFDATNLNLTDAAREVLVPKVVDKVKEIIKK